MRVILADGRVVDHNELEPFPLSAWRAEPAPAEDLDAAAGWDWLPSADFSYAGEFVARRWAAYGQVELLAYRLGDGFGVHVDGSLVLMHPTRGQVLHLLAALGDADAERRLGCR